MITNQYIYYNITSYKQSTLEQQDTTRFSKLYNSLHSYSSVSILMQKKNRERENYPLNITFYQHKILTLENLQQNMQINRTLIRCAEFLCSTGFQGGLNMLVFRITVHHWIPNVCYFCLHSLIKIPFSLSYKVELKRISLNVHCNASTETRKIIYSQDKKVHTVKFRLVCISAFLIT